MVRCRPRIAGRTLQEFSSQMRPVPIVRVHESRGGPSQIEHSVAARQQGSGGARLWALAPRQIRWSPPNDLTFTAMAPWQSLGKDVRMPTAPKPSFLDAHLVAENSMGAVPVGVVLRDATCGGSSVLECLPTNNLGKHAQPAKRRASG